MTFPLAPLLRYSVFAILLALCAWQGYLVFMVHQTTVVFQAFGSKPGMAGLIIYSQPLLWVFLCLTGTAAFDVLSRKDCLVLNSLIIAIAFTLATIFIQLFVVVATYLPMFELGSPK